MQKPRLARDYVAQLPLIPIFMKGRLGPMPDEKFIYEVKQLRETNADAAKICNYWPIVRVALEFLRSLPVPEKVKEAIDVILSFGGSLCPKAKVEKGETTNAPFEALVKSGVRPEWMDDVDWAIGNTGPVDCPEQYLATYPECIFGGGRSCLMRKAIDSAKANNCSWAFRLTLITQCHNGAAQLRVANAGQDAICNYLKTHN
jgi:hypothetical protein